MRKAPKSTCTSLLSKGSEDDGSLENDENYARRVWHECKHAGAAGTYGRICRTHGGTLSHGQCSLCNSGDYAHMLELQCTAYAHAQQSPGSISGDYFSDKPYGHLGQPRAQPSQANDHEESVRSCAVTVQQLRAPNSPAQSFATFKAPTLSRMRAPVLTPPSVRQLSLNPLDVDNDSSIRLYGVDIPEDSCSTPPELKPDVVTSNNVDGVPTAGTLPESQERH